MVNTVPVTVSGARNLHKRIDVKNGSLEKLKGLSRFYKTLKSILAGAFVIASLSVSANWEIVRSGTVFGPYNDFNSAVGQAQAGDTIKLLQDISVHPGTPTVIQVPSLIVDLNGHSVNLDPPIGPDHYIKVVAGANVCLTNGYVTGNGLLIEVERGFASLNDIHVTLGTGRPLSIQDGGIAEVVNGAELSLNNDTPTILIRGDRSDGGTAQGIRSILKVRDGGLVNNGDPQQGKAIAGVMGDPIGTDISLVGGTSASLTNVGLPSKITSSHGIAVYHPQPGYLEANGEIAGVTCVAMLNGSLTVCHPNALLQCIPPPPYQTTFFYDGSMPTGDTIIAPFGTGNGLPDPTVAIRDGVFRVASTADNVCLRTVEFGQPLAPNAISANIAISGGWFETPVSQNHCASISQGYSNDYEPCQDPNGCPFFPMIYTVRVAQPRVDINGVTGYPSLEAAFAVVQNGETINLLANRVEMSAPIEVFNNVILRLHGKSIVADSSAHPGFSGAASAFVLRRGARLEIDGTNTTTQTRGEIVTDLPTAIQLNQTGEPMTGPQTALIVKNTLVQGVTFGICGIDLSPAPSTTSSTANLNPQTDVVVESSVVKGSDPVESIGIRQPQYGLLLIDDSTVTGMSGIEFDAGYLNVRNGSRIVGDSHLFSLATGSGYPNPYPVALPGNRVAGVGVGMLIAPRHPVSVNVYGGSSIDGGAGIYEEDLYGVYHPIMTQFRLNLGDCWISGNPAQGGKTVYCNHGWDFTQYAVDVGSLAKFKKDDFVAGPLPVGHYLQLQTSGAAQNWYMLASYPQMAANEVMVVYKPILPANAGMVLSYSQRISFPTYSPGVSFGPIPVYSGLAPAPTGYTIAGYFADYNLTQAWDFSADILRDYPSLSTSYDALTDSLLWGGGSNVKILYVNMAPAPTPVGPGSHLPWVFSTSPTPSTIAASVQVLAPQQVRQSTRINPTAYQNLFTVQPVEVRSPFDPNRVCYICQMVLRKDVAEQQRVSLKNAMRRMPLQQLATGESSVRIATTPGLFYSVISGATLDTMTEGPRILAEGTEVELPLPSYSGRGFYRLSESETPE